MEKERQNRQIGAASMSVQLSEVQGEESRFILMHHDRVNRLRCRDYMMLRKAMLRSLSW